ncbi:hypothetical protein D9613_012886 [Agrocybe pediades]|uniref:Uncharacterized protein n=1 Tax=Agrocybe pediades TaxID=84607 RepID=A0A8H4QQZ6_9AGAR|nr:hypothetical protein D9613_012886 [Agrocybe pediades]
MGGLLLRHRRSDATRPYSSGIGMFVPYHVWNEGLIQREGLSPNYKIIIIPSSATIPPNIRCRILNTVHNAHIKSPYVHATQCPTREHS